MKQRVWVAGAMALVLANCGPSETVTQYGGSTYDWRLTEIDGTEVTYQATLELSENGAVDGAGPCNGFSGSQSAPYPWIDIQIDFVEELYCADIDHEEAYLAALSEMSLVEVAGTTMIMSNEAGRQMVFSGIGSDAPSDP
ncbi:META domain-containing protein [Shimia sp. R11_0]|uniref:META domain-containing protein n=1 Tax=Shimia sp. R11_0 TaxID=2821096 RepID=UPI001FFE00A2|nr:META domain-containing protein [Shimia sp. R11_0]